MAAAATAQTVRGVSEHASCWNIANLLRIVATFTRFNTILFFLHFHFSTLDTNCVLGFFSHSLSISLSAKHIKYSSEMWKEIYRVDGATKKKKKERNGIVLTGSRSIKTNKNSMYKLKRRSLYVFGRSWFKSSFRMQFGSLFSYFVIVQCIAMQFANKSTQSNETELWRTGKMHGIFI